MSNGGTLGNKQSEISIQNSTMTLDAARTGSTTSNSRRNSKHKERAMQSGGNCCTGPDKRCTIF